MFESPNRRDIWEEMCSWLSCPAVHLQIPRRSCNVVVVVSRASWRRRHGCRKGLKGILDVTCEESGDKLWVGGGRRRQAQKVPRGHVVMIFYFFSGEILAWISVFSHLETTHLYCILLKECVLLCFSCNKKSRKCKNCSVAQPSSLILLTSASHKTVIPHQ